MNTEKVISRDNDYILHTYGRSQVVLAEGEGMTARDATARATLTSRRVSASTRWATATPRGSGLWPTRPQRCSTRRTCITPPPTASWRKSSAAAPGWTPCSSATRARGQRGCDQVRPQIQRRYLWRERNKVITLVNSFHGRTLATLTATGQDVFHHDFGPFPGNFDYVPAGDFAALEKPQTRTPAPS